MTTYIQTQNKNSFSLKYKKYKRLGSDIWGHIAFINKKNAFTKIMKEKAKRELLRKIRYLSRRKKRRIKRRFKLYTRYKPFTYSVDKKPKRPRNNRSTRQSQIKAIKKKIKAFYHLRMSRKSLRKLMHHRKYRNVKSRSNNISFLEARFDVMLYRLNFISSIFEGRRIIRAKKAFVLGPTNKNNRHKFFSAFTMRKAYHQIPIFFFVTLTRDLAIQRKIYLKNMIYALKLVSFPPYYLACDYSTMIGMRLFNPLASKIRYPFGRNLSSFIGAAIYF